jgi:ABC-2 type transport system permease protein
MSALRAIAGRVAWQSFGQPGGWVLLAGFHLLAGVLWLGLVDGYVAGSSGTDVGAYGSDGLRVHDHLLAPWLGHLSVLMLLLGPAVAMRTLADEIRQHTLPLLLSAPVSAGTIVAGTFLGAWSALLAALASTAWAPLWVAAHAPVDPGPLLTAYAAVAAVAAVATALGVAASALTPHPAVAAVLATATGIALWTVGLIDPDPDGLVARLALSGRVDALRTGLVRPGDLAWLLTAVVASLTVAHARVDTWRRA